MSYALTSPLPSIRMTLSSTSGEGEATNKKKYILSRRIEVPPNYKALVSLESLTFIKPCLFHPSYYDGTLYCAELDITYRTTAASRTATNAQYPTATDTVTGLIQALTTLRALMRNITTDNNIDFVGLDGLTVLYTVAGTPSLRESFYASNDNRMFLRTTTANRTYTMEGRWTNFFGGVNTAITFSNNSPAYVRVSVTGHNIISVNTSLGEKNLSNLNGSDQRIVDSDITEMIQLNVRSGGLVTYRQQHAGCKLSLADSQIDTFTIELRDEWGDALPGVDRYICTLMIDFFPVGDASDNSVSLFDVRKRLRQGGYYSMK